MSYKVRLDIFEGPFDLLVYLIEHARMSIYDIRVSEITTQYLDYLDEMKANDIAVTQEFMVLAAELIELKSKMLLPQTPVEGDVDEAEDPRRDLVERLLEYKRFKEMAAFLSDQEELMEHIHSKPKEDLSVYEEHPDEILRSTPEQFASAFRSFLFRKQRLEEMRRTYERIERQRVNIEHKVSEIRGMFGKKKKVLFSAMLGKDTSAFNRVVTFMALLEMLKDRSVKAEQKKLFADISVTLTGEKG